MIRNTTQDWTEGKTVQVGFLKLIVQERVGNDYYLSNAQGTKAYRFTPHQGLQRVEATFA